MANVFYLPSSSDAPTISPTVHGNWNGSATAFNRVRASVDSKTSTSRTAMATYSVAGGDKIYCYRQYITPPLSGDQSVNGTFSAAIFGTGNDAQTTAALQLMIRVIDSDGTTVRGTCYTAKGASAGNFSTAGQTDRFSAKAFTTVSALDGDFIVFEIGVYNPDASAQDSALTFGDDQSGDYVYTSSSSATNLNCTIKFNTVTLTFGAWPGGGSTATPNQLMQMGCGI